MDMQKCITDCLACYEECLTTKQYCIEQGGMHTEPTHLQALADCAEACRTSAHFMITNSPLHPQYCGVCAEACKTCAESCEAMEDDERMKECAKMCRRCEESCKTMAGAMSTT